MSRVLFDHNVPAGLRSRLPNHTVRTAAQEGWDTLTNGDLLAAAYAASFDVMVTGDKNLAYQQNLTRRRPSLVILGTPTWPVVRGNLALISDAIDRATPGSYEVLPFDRPRRRPMPQ